MVFPIGAIGSGIGVPAWLNGVPGEAAKPVFPDGEDDCGGSGPVWPGIMPLTSLPKGSGLDSLSPPKRGEGWGEGSSV